MTPLSVITFLVAVCASVVAYPTEPEIKFTSTPASTTDLDPDHVPSSVCDSMMPDHGPNSPIQKDAPYVIKAERVVVQGQTINVVVKGLVNETFKGLYIQGRINDKPVGRWLKPKDNLQVNVSDCPPGKENALSYVSRVTALPSITLEWEAPKDVTGEIVFRATVLKSYSEFWIGVESPSVKLVSA